MRAQHRRFSDRRLLFSSLVLSVQALGLPVDVEQCSAWTAERTTSFRKVAKEGKSIPL